MEYGRHSDSSSVGTVSSVETATSYKGISFKPYVICHMSFEEVVKLTISTSTHNFHTNRSAKYKLVTAKLTAVKDGRCTASFHVYE